MVSSRRDFLWGSALTIALAGCGGALSPGPSPSPSSSGATRAKSKRIIVVGAGITALALAIELRGRGYDPVLLEASKRPGGRIHTIREPFRDGLYVEAGATHVVPDPDLLALIDLSKVELVPRKHPAKKPAEITLRGGKRYVTPPDPEPPPEFALTDDEKALGQMGRIKKYFAPIIGIDVTAPLPAELLVYDAMSARQFLTSAGASDGAALGFGRAFAPDAPLDDCSALALMREIANFVREVGLTGKGGRVAGGSDKFPSALADLLSARPTLSGDPPIVYGAKVTRVDDLGDAVRVSFEKDGATSTLEGDRCVSTLPSTLLGAIAWAKPLSVDKAKAVRELTLVNVARVWLATTARFWADKNESGNVDTDDALGNLRDETELQDGASGVLGLYVTGSQARELTAMSEDERAKIARAFAERAQPGLADHCYATASKCWDEDPLQRGAYAHFKPHELATLVPALAAREGRVHFAGDQTSYRPGFMHGAIASAKRVAKEIVEG